MPQQRNFFNTVFVQHSFRVAVCLLAIHAGLLAWSGYRHSPTIDEPAHLAAGISHWKFGRMDLYSVNPPLVRMVAALPVMVAQPEMRWGQFRSAESGRAEFSVGEAFADANGERIFWLTTLARWVCIPFSLLGGWFCYVWAKELFGELSGLLSLALWCFSPTILGNGSLITADVPSAAICVTTTYFFWKWLQRPGWSSAFITGVGLGLALLTKSSMILMCGLLPFLWLLTRAIEARKASKSAEHRPANVSLWKETLQVASLIVLAILVLNLGYGFEGAGQRLNEFEFHSRSLGAVDSSRTSAERGNWFAGTILGEIPVPFPKNFVLGIDHQKRDFETGLRSYLFGEIKTDGEGWWWFYIYAAFVKVPLGTWLLALLAIPRAIHGKLVDQIMLVVPALFFIVLVSSQVGLNFYRYLLPAFPFIFIWISQAVSERVNRSFAIDALCVIAMSWSVVSSMLCFPHSLSYFNEVVGGPKNGYRLMVDANLDWGQDLIYLKEWIEENPSARGMDFSYYGPIDPILVGLDVHVDGTRAEWSEAEMKSSRERSRKSQWVAISVTTLGHQVALHAKLEGAGSAGSSNAFELLYNREPDKRIGYSIHLYKTEMVKRLVR